MEPEDEPLTQTIRQTAKELNIGVNQCYEAAQAGRDPDHPNRQAHSRAEEPLAEELEGAAL